jgi:glucuronosyltransferase
VDSTNRTVEYVLENESLAGAYLESDKVKAFITHGGLNSVNEAIYAGKPIIAIPLFADQEHNIAIAVQRGVAIRLDKLNLSNVSQLTSAIDQIIHNSR